MSGEVVHMRVFVTGDIHGDEDDFVPYPMSQVCYDACASEKEFLTVPGARHAISYLVDTPTYEKTVTAFFKKHL